MSLTPMTDPAHTITTLGALERLFDHPNQQSVVKETDHIHPTYKPFIEASPFAVLATAGPGGLDASPRGDPAGFVVVQDAKTLLIPDRRGNNRIDSLRNIVTDSRVALLFLVPGVGESLRVHGRATISIAPELLDRFRVGGKPPKCVLMVNVEAVYFQCARAILRSRLWDASMHVDRSSLPTAGTMLEQISHSAIDGAAYDQALPQRQRDTLY